MAGGKLDVQIGADITDFEKKIKEVEFDIKELSKVKLDRLKLGLDTTEINAQIKDAKNNLNGLKTAVKDTGQTFQGMAPKVANGGNALMQFSRIAQDAPFGIIGIGNNITATVEAFGHLKNSTGSTGGALKALASSIAGTGGILLGVSLLTTGLTLLAQSGLSVGDVIDKITGNFDSLGKSIKDAYSEAAKNSASEIANMKALVSVAQDENLTREKRLIAVKELQQEFPAYFGNLTKEQILNGNVKTAVEGVTEAIVARAKANALSSKIGELAKEELQLNEKLEQTKKDLLDSEIENARVVRNSIRGSESAALRSLQTNTNISEIKNDIAEIEKDIVVNQGKQLRFAELINNETKKSILLKKDVEKPVKTFVTPQVSGIGQTILPAPVFATKDIEVFNGQIDSFGNKIKSLPGVMQTTLPQITNTIQTETAKMELALIDFNNRANEIISGALVDTFSGLGMAIGDALANGSDVLSAVGATLLDSLGSLLVQMGKMAIQVGVGLLAIKTALKSLNPAVAIGAGVALVALGSFFSSKAKSIGNTIGGGGTSGSSGSGANNTSFSSSGFTSRGDGSGTVVFEISGQRLIGVLSNTLNANRRLGGQLGL